MTPQRIPIRVASGLFERVPICPKHSYEGDFKPCDAKIWKRIADDYDQHKVFLNIPYTSAYKKRRHLLVAFLCQFGLIPVLASDKPREGTIRLCKLCELIQYCQFVISDISYVDRHNVPMELGLAFGLGRRHIVLFGGKKMRVVGKNQVRTIDSRLSNIRWIDEIVYYDGNKSMYSLVRVLLRRWRESPSLRKILKARIPTDRHEFEALITAILKAQRWVARRYEIERDYATIIHELTIGRNMETVV